MKISEGQFDVSPNDIMVSTSRSKRTSDTKLRKADPSEAAVNQNETNKIRNPRSVVVASSSTKGSSDEHLKTQASVGNSVILNQLASLANIDPQEASHLLSEEALEALKSLDPAVLVVTLTTLIGSLMKGKVKGSTTVKIETASQPNCAERLQSPKNQEPQVQ